MRRFGLIITLAIAACAGEQAQSSPTPGHSAPPGTPAAVTGVERAFPELGLQRPTNLVAPPGDDRLFVTEKGGRIRVFRPGSGRAETFLDLTARVDDSGSEMGLLGLAFHPRYAENRQFYVNYTAGSPLRTVISRFTASASSPDVAEAGSELVLLTFDQPYTNHNGGQLAFGPDGMLYIGTGDGGGPSDPQDNAQNRKTLLGKWLRIDVDRKEGEASYAIPADNPYRGGSEGFRPEIYAYGLRNLWRFSHDAETGRWWGADVGQNAVEEIDVLEKGRNYGWDILEGDRCNEPSSGCDQRGLTPPVATYRHDQGQAITGGFVYRGSRLPSLQGAYVYGDFVSGRIWALRYDGARVTENQLLVDSELLITTFGVDRHRELYVVDYNGGIYRLK